MRPLVTVPFPAERRIVLGGLRAGRHAAYMSALVQLDVTEAERRARAEGVGFSAVLVAAVGRAVAAHPEVHAYRDWLGRLVIHSHVDIATLIEVETERGPFPLAHSVRDADIRAVKAISAELERIREDPSSVGTGRALLRWGPRAGWLPGLPWLMFAVARRSPRVRSRIGTVSLTSVGPMMGGNGFGLGVPTVATLSVVIGGISERPWVVDGQVVPRRILDLAAQVDHRVVDGAPASRFGATLRRLLETPELLEW